MNYTINNITSYIPGTGGNCGGTYRIFVFVIFAILIYSFILKFFFGVDFSSKDFMNYNVFCTNSLGCLSYWPFSHLILFFILGILFPDCDKTVIGAGIVWEIIEEIYGLYFKTYVMKTTAKPNENIQYQEWWGGTISDIVINIIGFYLGKFFARVFNLNIKIPYINDEKVINT